MPVIKPEDWLDGALKDLETARLILKRTEAKIKKARGKKAKK